MSDTMVVTTGNSAWVVKTDLKALFPDEGEVPFDQWQRRGQLQVVKSGPHRAVYRLSLPETDLFLKHYKTPNLRSRLKNLIRGSDARREYYRAQQVGRRGIATITPVAFGERRAGGMITDSYLVCREITRATGLDHYLETIFPALDPSVRGPMRRELARQLAELTAAMHLGGIAHDDFHAGNLMVETDNEQPIRLHLIDLQAVRVLRPLAWRRARRNLVLLNLWFFQRASRSDRLRFLIHYLDKRPGLVKDKRRAANEIERRTWSVALKFWRRNPRRCMRTCRDFYRIDLHGRTAFALRRVPKPVLEKLLEDPRAPLADAEETRLKESPRTTVARVKILLGGRHEDWVLKRVGRKSWWHGFWRDNAGRRAWKAAHALADSHVPTPRPQVLIESSHARLGRESFLFTSWIEGGLTLDRHLRERIATLPVRARREQVRTLTEQLAALVRRLHENRFDHRDLKALNFVVALGEGTQEKNPKQPEATDSQCTEAGPCVFLLDLDCVRRRRFLSQGRRTQNLARLHVSFHADPLATRTDKLRFLRRYLPWGLRGRHDWKALWRRIDCLTQQKIRRNQKRGRVIS